MQGNGVRCEHMDIQEFLAHLRQNVVNPVLSAPGCALRDPAIYYLEGEFHLYFTLVKGLYDDRQSWFIGHTKTPDFIFYSEISCISPKGYASPGNVFRYKDRYVICYQSYPRTSVAKAPGDECRIFFSYSDDLEDWGDPEIISEEGCVSPWATTGSWRRRQIDPYVLVENDTCYLFYKGGYHLGLWASDDLNSWKDLTSEKPLVERGPESWSHGAENPCALKVDDTFYLFYDSTGRYEGKKPNRLHYKTSKDLIDWDPGHAIDLPDGESRVLSYGAPFFIDLRDSHGLFLAAYHTGGDRTGSDRYLTDIGIGWSEDFKTWRFLESGNLRIAVSKPMEP